MIYLIFSQTFDIKIEQSRIEIEINSWNSNKVKVEAKSYGYEEQAKDYYKYKISENTKFTIPQSSKVILKVIGNIACGYNAVVLNKCENDFAKIKISGTFENLDIECKLCSIEFNTNVNEGRALIDNGIIKGSFRSNKNFNLTFMNSNADLKGFYSSGRIINRDSYIKLKSASSLKIIYSKDLGDFKIYSKNIKCFACSGEEGSSDKVLYVDQSNGSFEISK